MTNYCKYIGRTAAAEIIYIAFIGCTITPAKNGCWILPIKFISNTADWTQQNNLPNWHNVNIAQCFREPATYYMQTKDSTIFNATYNDFYLIRNLYGQVPGGMFGADENARKGYNDPRQAVETCGMVEQMASDEILNRHYRGSDVGR